MTAITLRRYLPSDQDTVLDLHVRALQQVGAYLGRGPRDDDMYDIPGYYLDAGGDFLVGEIDGRVVAMGALLPTGAHEAEVKRMRVEPDLQGRGYGGQILTVLEERARALGFWRLHLDTSSLQEPALRLYHRRGYVETYREWVRDLELIFHEKRLDLAIRPFTSADQQAARTLVLNGLGDHWGTIDETLNPDLDDIAASYLAPGDDFWLAFRDESLAASGALIATSPGIGSLVRMSVRRDLRRLGIGRHMVYQLVAQARRRGMHRVEVETTRTWDDAIGLYERCGFTRDHEDDESVYLNRFL